MTATGGPPAYPFEPQRALELDSRYATLRVHAPVARVRLPYGGEAWLVTRYPDVRKVLSDPRFSRAAVVGADIPRVRPEIDQSSASILSMDPPEHTRLRKLVAKTFTTRRMAELRPRVRALTTELLGAMRAAGPGADLVKHVSVPLPVTIICELLEVPVADRAIFRAGADAALSSSMSPPERRAQARQDMLAYMAGMVAQRRITPTDDLLGALVLARDEGDHLSETELVTIGVTLVVAGHETTMNHIGNMAYTLLSQPDRGAALRGDEHALARGIEELLRFVPLGTSATFPRVATQDVVLYGVTIHAGDTVIAAMSAANRDPAVFADPEHLMLDRTMTHHLGFGHGPHFCLGAQLARIELQERPSADCCTSSPTSNWLWHPRTSSGGPDRSSAAHAYFP